MIDIRAYMRELVGTLKTVFENRLLYVGLQGSYLRAEATEKSDIDVMVVIDEMKPKDLRDYKFYCFNGEVKFVMINSDRNSNQPTKADYFDRSFNWLDFQWGYEHSRIKPEKPHDFEKMIEIAEKLSQNMKHVRIDLYYCANKIYFGEITFFDGSGFDKIEPVEWDYKIGSWIEL